LGKHKCSNCNREYYINLAVDIELACPKCGFVESNSLIGQKTGRSDNIADD
tara:strand:- start:74 stop:226 length:153 start_codon:yes stop_codon:yes gene_type:complete